MLNGDAYNRLHLAALLPVAKLTALAPQCAECTRALLVAVVDMQRIGPDQNSGEALAGQLLVSSKPLSLARASCAGAVLQGPLHSTPPPTNRLAGMQAGRRAGMQAGRQAGRPSSSCAAAMSVAALISSDFRLPCSQLPRQGRRQMGRHCRCRNLCRQKGWTLPASHMLTRLLVCPGCLWLQPQQLRWDRLSPSRWSYNVRMWRRRRHD